MYVCLWSMERMSDLWRKTMIYSQAMFFAVVIYGCESWTIKKAECQRIDVFKLWCWRRLLRVPWRARRSNQSIQKEINAEYSLEGLMLKLKLQYSDHLIRRAHSLEKTLMLRKIEGRMRWLVSITDSMDMSLSKLPGIVKDRGAWQATVHGIAKSQTCLSDWTTTTMEGKKNRKGVYHQAISGYLYIMSKQEISRFSFAFFRFCWTCNNNKNHRIDIIITNDVISGDLNG